MSRAEEIIDLRNRELSAQANIRNLWQETGDKMYPYVQITSQYADGQPRTTEIYDQTPLLDSEDMVSGLKYILIPSGQPFFAIKAGDNNTDVVQRYTSVITEGAHDEIFKSNFITEFDEVLRSLILFGPATLYSEWTVKDGLNYKACVIGSYQYIENSKRRVGGIFYTAWYTPAQAIEEFGEENISGDVRIALADSKKQNDRFEFIYYVKPRATVNPSISRRVKTNMPWQSEIVDVKAKEMMGDEGGYLEFPYHSARWKRPANEKHGRGIGTEILPQVRVLDRTSKNYIDCGNLHNNPPREVLDTHEGPVRVTPGARNDVQEIGTIKALDMGLLGNFPITEKSLIDQREIIHRAFFKNAFSPLEDLTGDRRTTLEIRERIKQAWPKIGPPITRIWYELLEGCIERSILLLIRNGVLPRPPVELQGANFGLEFVGPFALELRSQQAKAFQEWVFSVGEMEAIFPGAKDNVDADDAIMRMGRTFGVNTEDMATEEERDEKRRIRAEQLAEQKALELAQVAGQAYPGTTKAPESGSPAEALMGT